MALWQLRLGERGQGIIDWREKLAHDYSLIAISYGINEDISKMETEEVEKHIKKINKDNSNAWVVNSYIRHVLNFKNGINKDDYIISPFNYLEGGGNFRIGLVTGEFGTLESLFKGDLSAYLAQHAYAPKLKKYLTIDECRNLPTRKVKWISDLISSDDIHAEIISQSDEGDGKGTVAKLRFSGQMPFELTTERIYVPLLDSSLDTLVNISKSAPIWLQRTVAASVVITSISLAITEGSEAVVKSYEIIKSFILWIF